MPVTVIVCPQGEDATRLTFDGTQRIVFGRGAGCDVRLPDPSVSHRHAYLCSDGGEFLLFDEASTNGTHVGGVRIAPRASRVVRSGDVVRLGRVTLELCMDGAPVTRDVAASTRELALSLVARALEAAGEDTTAAVRVVEGADRGRSVRLREEGRDYIVGRGVECDLVVGDTDASRQHVSVRRDGDHVSVRDLNSKNGTWLGSACVMSDEVSAWRSSTMLRIGRTVLALEQPVQDALARIEGVADEFIKNVDESGHETIPSGVSEGLLLSGTGPTSPALAEAASPAPVAAIPNRASRGRVAQGVRWSAFDVLVVIAALAVLALSLVGLAWLLRS